MFEVKMENAETHLYAFSIDMSEAYRRQISLLVLSEMHQTMMPALVRGWLYHNTESPTLEVAEEFVRCL